MKRTIYPNDMLPKDTRVYVINRGAGKVVSAKQTTDQFRQPIVVHTIELDNGETKEINYSFIVQP